MRATMTDVQKALEQLGRGETADDCDDGARSFSFASTKEGGDTETDDTDFDLSDLDGGPDEGDREDWHKTARRKLAAKARRAVENAKQLEAMMHGTSASTRRIVAPPIDVEISDESEGEEGEDFTKSSQFKRTHPGILEEDESEGEAQGKPNKEPSPAPSAEPRQDVEVPPRDESDVPTATVLSFQLPSQPESTLRERTPDPEPAIVQAEVEKSVESEAVAYPTPASLAPTIEAATSLETTTNHQKRVSSLQNGLPSPAASSQTAHSNLDVVARGGTPEHQTRRPQTNEVTQTDELKKIPTMEWNVGQVIQWLKSKGFDQSICDKFIGVLGFLVCGCP